MYTKLTIPTYNPEPLVENPPSMVQRDAQKMEEKRMRLLKNKKLKQLMLKRRAKIT